MTRQSFKLGKPMTEKGGNRFGSVWWRSVILNPSKYDDFSFLFLTLKQNFSTIALKHFNLPKCFVAGEFDFTLDPSLYHHLLVLPWFSSLLSWLYQPPGKKYSFCRLSAFTIHIKCFYPWSTFRVRSSWKIHIHSRVLLHSQVLFIGKCWFFEPPIFQTFILIPWEDKKLSNNCMNLRN